MQQQHGRTLALLDVAKLQSVVDGDVLVLHASHEVAAHTPLLPLSFLIYGPDIPPTPTLGSAKGPPAPYSSAISIRLPPGSVISHCWKIVSQAGECHDDCATIPRPACGSRIGASRASRIRRNARYTL